MNNKLSPGGFQISPQITKSNITKTLSIFLLTLVLCIISISAQQDGRRLPNSGESSGKTGSAEITGQPAAPEGIQTALLDGGFETSTGQFPTAANGNWAQSSTSSNPPLCGTGCPGTSPPRTGNYRMLLGGSLLPDTASFQQGLTFLPGRGYVLKYWLRVSAVSAPFNATMTVKIGTTVLQTITEPSAAQGAYSQMSVVIPQNFAANAFHTIRFEYVNPVASGVSNFLIDDITLEQVASLDGGFESSTGNFPNETNANWTQSITLGHAPLCGLGCWDNINPPRTGNYLLSFGELGLAVTASIQQANVIFPVGSRPVLKYWFRAEFVEAPYNTTITVKIDGNVIQTILEPTASQPAYSLVSVAIPPGYADGLPHTLRFEFNQLPLSGTSRINIDDIYIEQNAVADGGFESGVGSPANVVTHPNWAGTSTSFTTPLCTVPACGGPSDAQPRTGALWTWFGGTGAAETASIEQSVVIPQNSRPVLKFWLRNGSVAAPFSSTLKVMVDGVTIRTIAEKTVADAAYSQVSIALPASVANGAAHTIRLEFVKALTPTSVHMTVDDITLDTSAAPLDFDGDRKSDPSIFRPSVGEWYFLSSRTGNSPGAQFGASTDKIAPADFTGDGKVDFAFFRPSDTNWYIIRSENSTFFAFPYGANGDIPAPGDFDGDGKADATIFRPSSGLWASLRSSDNQSTILQFGANGDIPVVADYDGDGKADFSVYRPTAGEWYTRRSSTNAVFGAPFGAVGDKPVQGDYTGDGKADFAIFRPSTGFWYVLRSEDQSFFGSPFGNSTDTPTIGDYDGDGKSDFGVFRPSTGNWFIQRSSNGSLLAAQFGVATDRPAPAYYLP